MTKHQFLRIGHKRINMSLVCFVDVARDYDPKFAPTIFVYFTGGSCTQIDITIERWDELVHKFNRHLTPDHLNSGPR